MMRPSLAAVLLAGGLGVFGCGQKPQPAPEAGEKPAAPTARLVDGDPEPKPVVKAVPRDRLHQAFEDAVHGPDNPPTDVPPPVDRTVTGKSAPRLFEQATQTWDSVRFTTKDGQSIQYVAELTTSQGTVKILMLPELAPNHARNFIVLARLGYYDGLRFDRIHQEQGENAAIHCVEAGCPLGTGDVATGSVGYWLKDEFTPADKCSHNEGIVGACRGVEADTAATKFYINLNTAPFRDGQYSLFGKVVEGLDVVRMISQVPVAAEAEDGARAKPRKPVVIHKVAIHETTVEASKK